VDYHNIQFINQIAEEENINKYNMADLQNLPPANIEAYNRYAYNFNNPIRYIDYSGYDPQPPPEWYEWLTEHVNIIWKNAPSLAKAWFQRNGKLGTRILTVDSPHPNTPSDFYHLNSDLKILRRTYNIFGKEFNINHYNIEPTVTKTYNFATNIKQFANNTVSSVKDYVGGITATAKVYTKYAVQSVQTQAMKAYNSINNNMVNVCNAYSVISAGETFFPFIIVTDNMFKIPNQKQIYTQ
jgi:hypothetical protein